MTAGIGTSGIGVTAPVASWHAPLIALSTGNIVVFWLFTRALFDETFRLRWWHAAVWLAVAAFSLVNCTLLAGSPGGGARLAVAVLDQLTAPVLGPLPDQTPSPVVVGGQEPPGPAPASRHAGIR